MANETMGRRHSIFCINWNLLDMQCRSSKTDRLMAVLVLNEKGLVVLDKVGFWVVLGETGYHEELVP